MLTTNMRLVKLSHVNKNTIQNSSSSKTSLYSKCHKKDPHDGAFHFTLHHNHCPTANTRSSSPELLVILIIQFVQGVKNVPSIT